MDSILPPATEMRRVKDTLRIILQTLGRVRYLFAVPSSTNSSIVVPNGDPAEWADQFTDFHVENVDETALKSAALQEDFATVFYTLVAVHDHVHLRVGACTPHISSHHLYIVNNS